MKLLILGNVASGKRALAEKLSKKYNIDYYELENINSKDEVEKILKNNNYILEGKIDNYFDLIIPKVSTIILLDYNIKVLKRRLFIKYLSRKINKNKYYDLLNTIDRYNSDFIKDIISKYPNKIIIIKNNRELKKLYIALEDGFEYKDKI